MYGVKEKKIKPSDEKPKPKKKKAPKKKGNPLAALLEKVLSDAATKDASDAKVVHAEWLSGFKGRLIVSRSIGKTLNASVIQTAVDAILESKASYIVETKDATSPVVPKPQPPTPTHPQLGSNQPQPPQPVVAKTAPVGKQASELKAVYIQRVQYSQWSPNKAPAGEPCKYWEVLFLMGPAAVDLVKRKKATEAKKAATLVTAASAAGGGKQRRRRRRKKGTDAVNATATPNTGPIVVESGVIGVANTVISDAPKKNRRRRRRRKKKTVQLGDDDDDEEEERPVNGKGATSPPKSSPAPPKSSPAPPASSPAPPASSPAPPASSPAPPASSPAPPASAPAPPSSEPTPPPPVKAVSVPTPEAASKPTPPSEPTPPLTPAPPPAASSSGQAPSSEPVPSSKPTPPSEPAPPALEPVSKKTTGAVVEEKKKLSKKQKKKAKKAKNKSDGQKSDKGEKEKNPAVFDGWTPGSKSLIQDTSQIIINRVINPLLNHLSDEEKEKLSANMLVQLDPILTMFQNQAYTKGFTASAPPAVTKMKY